MNNTKGMSPERLERISNYARWLIENTGKGQRRGLAEAYLALEARCAVLEEDLKDAEANFEEAAAREPATNPVVDCLKRLNMNIGSE